ncbi:hypothetical protein E2C01_081523 [Portunus trituberculatus]|uniref:Uncharacterized protein n=1 Tax=Portunus trituberculatus TaxID=210409 RepID=A0A5B7IZ29_PORTR|nr:hypothetical protein [Portunus trituberculatus]
MQATYEISILVLGAYLDSKHLIAQSHRMEVTPKHSSSAQQSTAAGVFLQSSRVPLRETPFTVLFPSSSSPSSSLSSPLLLLSISFSSSSSSSSFYSSSSSYYYYYYYYYYY